MKREFLSTTCMMALWIGGCPMRHPGTRLVYAPAAERSAQPVAPAAGDWVIEEPPPPPPTQPALGVPSEVPGQVPIKTRPFAGRRNTGPQSEASTEPPVEVPTLQPREEDQDALRRKVVALQQNIDQRITRLERDVSAGTADRKTREDARAFLVQSMRALEDGDLQRAWNLAHKASLLVAALGP